MRQRRPPQSNVGELDRAGRVDQRSTVQSKVWTSSIGAASAPSVSRHCEAMKAARRATLGGAATSVGEMRARELEGVDMVHRAARAI